MQRFTLPIPRPTPPFKLQIGLCLVLCASAATAYWQHWSNMYLLTSMAAFIALQVIVMRLAPAPKPRSLIVGKDYLLLEESDGSVLWHIPLADVTRIDAEKSQAPTINGGAAEWFAHTASDKYSIGNTLNASQANATMQAVQRARSGLATQE